MAKEIAELYIKKENLPKFIRILEDTGHTPNNFGTYQVFSKTYGHVFIKLPHSDYSPSNSRYSFINITSSKKNSAKNIQRIKEELASESRQRGISITQYV